MIQQQPLVKVQFYNRDVGYENLWANELGKNKYRIESIPFFIYGVSRHDIVKAAQDETGRLEFRKVLERSGSSTLRARSQSFITDKPFKRRVTAALKKHGCGVEELRSRLLAIDVPQNVNLQGVTDYLTNEAKVQWEYGNPEKLNRNLSASG